MAYGLMKHFQNPLAQKRPVDNLIRTVLVFISESWYFTKAPYSFTCIFKEALKQFYSCGVSVHVSR